MYEPLDKQEASLDSLDRACRSDWQTWASFVLWAVLSFGLVYLRWAIIVALNDEKYRCACIWTLCMVECEGALIVATSAALPEGKSSTGLQTASTVMLALLSGEAVISAITLASQPSIAQTFSDSEKLVLPATMGCVSAWCFVLSVYHAMRRHSSRRIYLD